MNQSAAAALSFPIPIRISFPANVKPRCNYGRNSPSLPLKASISTSNFPLASRIIVKNLEYSVSESSLQKEFSNFGEIAEGNVMDGRWSIKFDITTSLDPVLVKDEVTKKSKGYAFIQYSSQDDAVLAMENMDCKVREAVNYLGQVSVLAMGLAFSFYQMFDGRMIYVELAKPRKSSFRGYPKASGPPNEVPDCWY